jgi:hypothetical protein
MDCPDKKVGVFDHTTSTWFAMTRGGGGFLDCVSQFALTSYVRDTAMTRRNGRQAMDNGQWTMDE